MEIIKIWNDSPSRSQVEAAADAIRRGELVIIPTDSVYAIVCDALNQKAIAELCRIKGINPEKNNLSIICSDISMAAEFTRIENEGFQLLKSHTPGPFTFLFPSGRRLPKAFKGRKTAGVRIPDCATARQIVESLGNPLLSTSITFADDDEAREPELIAERYERHGISLLLDGGDGGSEYSTIVDCTGDEPEIVRQGKGVI
ncbi:MAG: threonylcarbamoyl-AMP synthase [Muribaculaceae bacterium]|nr:threonylcarbamoyl-AMP synthase [Muribaculaceae bacterium]